jgi:hypothetical protein
MRHIRSYQELFEAESGRQVYHVSRTPISAIGTTPMFFSLSLRDALGFFESALMDGLGAVLYSARISPTAKIAEDPESVLSDSGIDVDAYMAEIVSNPSSDEVMALGGTQLLLSQGFNGMIYPDYDMWDTDRDVDTLLIFTPEQSIKGFREIDGPSLHAKHISQNPK